MEVSSDLNDNLSDINQDNNQASEENKEENKEEKEEEKEEVVTDDELAKEVESKLSDEELEKRRSEAEDMRKEGNELFKQKSYIEAERVYTSALRHCPIKYSNDRSIIYSNRAAAKIHLDKRDKAISDCSKAIELNSTYVKVILRRAHLYRQAEDKLDQALSDYNRVLELDPSCTEAKIACAQLPDEINQRNEKMKQEMLGKLKDLGNLVLKPFGLSTENFKLSQTENGGYTVNFQNK